MIRLKKWLNSLRSGEKGIFIYLVVIIVLFLAAAILFASGVASRSAWKTVTALGLIGINIYLLKHLSDEEIEKKPDISKEKKQKEEKSSEKEEEISYENYNTNQQLQYVLLSHKVKKENKTVMIDLWEKYKVKQCPAYMWREKNKLCFLLLENKPRTIDISLNEIEKVVYEKGVLARPSLEYVSLRKSPLMNSVFSPFLPSYYEESRNGITVFRKNLYVVSTGIKFTNGSIRAIFDLLDLDFEVKDNCTNSDRFNDYFKLIYKQNILFRDQVLEVSEFQNKIKKLLKDMADASINDEIFEETLELLVSYRLIPQEYREFFQQYRQKNKSLVKSK